VGACERAFRGEQPDSIRFAIAATDPEEGKSRRGELKKIAQTSSRPPLSKMERSLSGATRRIGRARRASPGVADEFFTPQFGDLKGAGET
jgi:hypothetical protein